MHEVDDRAGGFAEQLIISQDDELKAYYMGRAIYGCAKGETFDINLGCA